MANRFLAAALAASLTILAAPLAALAQDDPGYAGQPSYATQDEAIHGRIVSFDGAYALQVRDDRGFIDNVQLHQGTIINPTGLTLAPGMVVAIHGYNAGGYFAANEVDTPYTLYGAVPYYSGHPWYYWGPSVSLGFFFGTGGWWRGGYGHGYYYPHGYVHPYGRGYAPPARAYGTYRAPAARGAYGYRAPSQTYGGSRTYGGGSRTYGGTHAAPAARGSYGNRAPAAHSTSHGGEHHH